MEEKLNIVNDDGQVIGEETREKIHRVGLLHKEIHVWFYTPNKEIIFQHRAKDKDTYPDKLDATVGGHVDLGSDFLDTAVKEVQEETGLVIKPQDLKLAKIIKRKSVDQVTGKVNNAIKAQYTYCYKGRVADLKVEADKAEGFEAWPIEKLLSIKPEEKSRFIHLIFDENDLTNLFKDILK
jgi:isopentenyl-diphosphate Delta-isomerase